MELNGTYTGLCQKEEIALEEEHTIGVMLTCKNYEREAAK